MPAGCGRGSPHPRLQSDPKSRGRAALEVSGADPRHDRNIATVLKNSKIQNQVRPAARFAGPAPTRIFISMANHDKEIQRASSAAFISRNPAFLRRHTEQKFAA